MPPCRLNLSLAKVEFQKGTAGVDNIVITTQRRRRRRVFCFDRQVEQDLLLVTMVANNFHLVTRLLLTRCLYIGQLNVRIG